MNRNGLDGGERLISYLRSSVIPYSQPLPEKLLVKPDSDFPYAKIQNLSFPGGNWF